jgi:hypothetical protein
VEEEEDGAAAELEPDADGEEAVLVVEVEPAEPAADFEDELEQPVRERAAATTATLAVVKEGRNLTMTPLVGVVAKGGKKDQQTST